MCEQAVYN